MTKETLLNLESSLMTLGELKGVKFAYAVNRNLALMKPEIEALSKATEYAKEYKEYETARVELAKKHAKKGEDGKPVVTNTADGKQAYDVVDMLAFETDLNLLKETHKEAIKAREQQIKDFQELLKTESPLELYKIKREDLPAEISVAQLGAIFELIED